MRTDEEIKEIVEGVLQALRCVAEIRDYGQKLRFRVKGYFVSAVGHYLMRPICSANTAINQDGLSVARYFRLWIFPTRRQ